MIKKISFTLIFCCLVISCGKKADPQYKDPKKEVKIQSILINRV
jgi:hypothetical protein